MLKAMDSVLRNRRERKSAILSATLLFRKVVDVVMGTIKFEMRDTTNVAEEDF